MKRIIIIFVLFVSLICKAQVTKGNIRQLLISQGIAHPDAEAEYLYNKYNETQNHDLSDLGMAVGESALSGISMGFNQSYTALYKNTGWLPFPLKNWYETKVITDKVFGKALTWPKVWRETDYIYDRMGYEDLYRYFNGKWYLALAVHLFVKNLTAAFIRNKFNYGGF